jgi:hypothetical protein
MCVKSQKFTKYDRIKQNLIPMHKNLIDFRTAEVPAPCAPSMDATSATAIVATARRFE